jgi:hypothetical protein
MLMNAVSKMYGQTSLLGTLSATSSLELEDGRSLFAMPDGRIIDQFGQEVARASLSARQAKALGLLTSGTCGQHSIGTSSSKSLESSLVSRLQARTLNTGSTLYKLTWKPWVMPSGLLRSRLRASVLRTSEIVFTGWVTATTRDHKDTPGMVAMRSDNGKARNDQLPRQAYLAGWPTPVANTRDQPVTERGLETLAGKAKLASFADMNLTSKPSEFTDALTVKAKDLIALNQPVRLTASGRILIGFCAGMDGIGQLNPAHSRWLMGYPPAWDDCAVMAMQSFQSKQGPSLSR